MVSKPSHRLWLECMISRWGHEVAIVVLFQLKLSSVHQLGQTICKDTFS